MSLSTVFTFANTFLSNLKKSTQVSNDDNYKENKETTENLINDISQHTSTTQSINDYFFKYKEIKAFYNFTGIEPKYLVYIISAILAITIINFFSGAFTLFVGVIYPVRCSMKEMSLGNKEQIRKWLEYWVVFFFFVNIETVFGNVFEKIPMYLFYKVVFLCVCFLPWYNGSHYIYNTYLREWFLYYEKGIYKYSVKLTKQISEKLLKDESED